MAELSAVPFSALPTSDDGYTLLNDNGIVHRSSKKLSELVGDKLSDLTEIISLLRNKPTTGTHVIKCIDGVLTWVAEP